MNKYLEELRKIDSDVFKNMGKTSQKTIDIVQETLEQLSRDYEEGSIQRDELGAINYEIDILLDVWNKDLQYDIEILNRVDKIIVEWYDCYYVFDQAANLMQEDYTSSFNYKGRTFIVDKFEDFWLVTESQFIIKERGETLEEATSKIKTKWDEVGKKYQAF